MLVKSITHRLQRKSSSRSLRQKRRFYKKPKKLRIWLDEGLSNRRSLSFAGLIKQPATYTYYLSGNVCTHIATQKYTGIGHIVAFTQSFKRDIGFIGFALLFG